MTATAPLTPKARAILDAAGDLFYARGIHAVGVDAIAAHAGVTKKTLYDRFGSKENLVLAYLRERDLAWESQLASRLAAAGPEPRARLAAVFDASAEWMGAHSPRGCSMINAHAEISDPEHPGYAIVTGQKRRMLALFVELARDAGAPDPERSGARALLAHEGALVAFGMGALPAAHAIARDLALEALETDIAGGRAGAAPTGATPGGADPGDAAGTAPR